MNEKSVSMLNILPFNQTSSSFIKIGWLTDLHLDAAKRSVIFELLRQINDQQPDFILVGGDTCNTYKALEYLLGLTKITKKDVYFVLGNHEFYHSSIRRTRQLAYYTSVCHSKLHYLSLAGIVELTPTVALIGHDGWADARAGDFMHSTVLLHDYHLIDDFKKLPKQSLQMKIHCLGSQAAKDIKKKLHKAFKSYNQVIILTHTPPFQAVCFYDKHLSDDNWAPHFVCKAMGDCLLKMMKVYPDKQVIVLAGHAHHLADLTILPNLRVIVGETTLGIPHLQGILHI